MRIGVLTSGGDAPGMNAAIRAVVRSADHLGWRIYGISYGYQGLSEKAGANRLHHFEELCSDDVVLILGRGGTILKSTRYSEFEQAATLKQALANLRAFSISNLIVIGGDGSFRGAYALYDTNSEHRLIDNLRIICIPATIDNDIPFTKHSIGADTALNTVVGCIDKIRDTAFSHKRAFVIQVMGRDCDYLPRMTGISSGAHIVLGPHETANIDEIIERIEDGFRAGKEFVIVVVAEGLRRIEALSSEESVEIADDEYSRFTAAEILKEKLSSKLRQVRPVVLGHVQRGGQPSCFDRVLATRFGVAATRALDEWDEGDNQPYMLALQNKGKTDDKIVRVPLSTVLTRLERSPRRVPVKYEFLNRVVIRGFPFKQEAWPEEL